MINPKLSSEFCVGTFADLTKCVVEILLNELSTVTVFYRLLSVTMKVGLELIAVPSTREHLIIDPLKEKKVSPMFGEKIFLLDFWINYFHVLLVNCNSIN